MEALFAGFEQAQQACDGYLLASCITPTATLANPGRLYEIVKSSTPQRIQADVRYATVYNSQARLSKAEAQAWQDVLTAFWKTVVELLTAQELTNRGRANEAQWSKVYDMWKELVNALIRGYMSNAFAAWTIPCLYVAGRYLRTFAVKADDQAALVQGDVTFNDDFQDDLVDASGKNDKLEDAARQINRIFGLCMSDRAPIEESRKWALYYTTNLLFKTYFKLNSISLSKNILRSLQASNSDMPPLSSFPKSHIVTFEYYVGVIHFLEENYTQASPPIPHQQNQPSLTHPSLPQAEVHLNSALRLCHRSAQRNKELILTYLIPCHLINTQTLPTLTLLAPFPRLQHLFGRLSSCIRRGDLAGFDAALASGQAEFVKRRIYLTLERTRDIALRNLFRRVFLAGGFEAAKDGGDAGPPMRRTRVPVDEFAAAIRLSMGPAADDLEWDEVECLIANMIYLGRMKGYIARTQQMVVLNKKGAFPGTGV